MCALKNVKNQNFNKFTIKWETGMSVLGESLCTYTDICIYIIKRTTVV